MRYAVPVFVILMGAVVLLAAQWAREMQRASAFGAAAPATSAPATLPANLRQATFAAGCFWGVQEAFKHLDGVTATEVGYTGGKKLNPTYEDVCTDLTGHAEAVLVTYDPAKISYAELLDAFWSCHDPTTLDRQGPDVGKQYRSVIFFHDAEQEKIAEASLKEVQDSDVFKAKIVTEIVAAGTFFKAEEYHQSYFEKLGAGGTCHTGVAVVKTNLGKQAAAQRAASVGQASKP